MEVWGVLAFLVVALAFLVVRACPVGQADLEIWVVPLVLDLSEIPYHAAALQIHRENLSIHHQSRLVFPLSLGLARRRHFELVVLFLLYLPRRPFLTPTVLP